VTYVHQEKPRLGVVNNGEVLDLAQAWQTFQAQTGASAGSCLPGDMLGLIKGGREMLSAVSEAVAWANNLPKGPRSVWSQPLDEIRLMAPLANPGKIICVGLNYHDHCRETGADVPERPVLFAKFPSNIIGPGETITWPPDETQKVDYEAELGVIIGKEGRHIPESEALDHVAGYTNVNDVSARDVQFADEQWVRGKSFDTFCPTGPFLLTADEVPDPQDLGIQSRLNGQVMQDSTTAEMIFGVSFLVAYISRTCALMPGDLLVTGTPGGVGDVREPPVYLQPGDLIEVEVEKLGVLGNPVG
jgi:2-keto-4-pentenoate hydratase/2-oxohepta-3-ene-1,7-dioic acid hydratase in catechol pathway